MQALTFFLEFIQLSAWAYSSWEQEAKYPCCIPVTRPSWANNSLSQLIGLGIPSLSVDYFLSCDIQLSVLRETSRSPLLPLWVPLAFLQHSPSIASLNYFPFFFFPLIFLFHFRGEWNLCDMAMGEIETLWQHL